MKEKLKEMKTQFIKDMDAQDSKFEKIKFLKQKKEIKAFIDNIDEQIQMLKSEIVTVCVEEHGDKFDEQTMTVRS